MIYDDIWWYMMIYDDIWWYMMIYDDIWWYMMIYDDIWWYMMIYDDIWWYMMIYDDIWWYMMIYDDIWWYMMIYDDIWWYMMIYDDIWWYMMIYDDMWVIMSQHELSICLDEHPGLPFHWHQKKSSLPVPVADPTNRGRRRSAVRSGWIQNPGFLSGFLSPLRGVWQLYDRYDTSVCLTLGYFGTLGWLLCLTLGLWGWLLWLSMTYSPCTWPSNNGSNDIYCIYIYITIKWWFPKVGVPLNCPNFLNHPCS